MVSDKEEEEEGGSIKVWEGKKETFVIHYGAVVTLC